MKKNKFLSDRDKETQKLALRYEEAQQKHEPIYLDSNEVLDLAGWYSTRFNDEQANEVVKYGLQLHPDSTELLTELAHQYLDHDDMEADQRIAGLISETDLPEAIILQARLLLREGQEAEADKLFARLDPYDLSNIVDVVDTYLSNDGSLDSAEAWLNRGFGRYDDDPMFISLAADFYYNDSQLDKAIEYYNKAIDTDPYNDHYWCELARCYYETEQYDKAIEACDYALISDDSSPEAHLLAGQAYLELDNNEGALKHFEQIKDLHLLPECVYLFIKGLALTKAEKWEEGYEYLERSLHAQGHDRFSISSVYENAAISLHHIGNNEKAELYFEKALEQTPENSELYYTFGRFYMEIKQTEKAIDRWSKAIRLNPIPEEIDSIATYCLEAGLIIYARNVLEILEEISPQHPKLHERLAVLCLLTDDEEGFKQHSQLSPAREHLEKLRNDIADLDEAGRQMLIDMLAGGKNKKE